MTSLTADIGRFVADLKFQDVPAEILPIVRNAFTDTVAVIMVGIDEPVADIVRMTLVEPSGVAEARACLSTHVVSAPGAALLGGAIAHCLDYDDQSLSAHPSSMLVPAILAEGEALGSTGEELVTAYVAGYEVLSELWRRDRNLHSKGWHPTSVFGVMAVAAAGSVLHRLTADQTSTALAIAASHAGGIFANFGSMTKGYHAGMAARNGLESARLAKAGLSAGADTIENKQGFLMAFSPGGKPDRDAPIKLGQDWYLPKHRPVTKLHPTCTFMHRSFIATRDMLQERPLPADDIASVEVKMGRGQVTVLVYDRPQTRYEAEFSGQYAIAAAVLLGRMGVPELADEVVQRADMQAFFPKVSLTPVDEFDERVPVFSPTESVTITLTSGEVIDSGPIASMLGYADNPVIRADR